MTASSLSPGARHFHRIIRFLALACVVATGIGAVSSFFVYLHKLHEVANGHDIYAGVKQLASLTYYSIWLGISLLGFAATFQKRFPMLPLYIVLAVLVEGGTFVHYFIQQNRLFVAPPRILLERFDRHPYLQVLANPGAYGIEATHDSEHRRTTINEGKAANPRYIYVFGGSTTYDVGVVDANTWPSRLSADLGPNFVVENYGIPLFSSLESMLQSLFVFRDRAPVCAIYYLGSNDIRSTHVKNVRVDLAELHSPAVVGVMHPGGRRNLLTTYSVFFATLDTIINPRQPNLPFTGSISRDLDPRLTKIVHDNIELITRIARSFGVKAIFIPEVPHYNMLVADAAYEIPYIKDKDIRFFLEDFDKTMKAAAEDAGGIYLGSNLDQKWTDDDFLDQGHFSAKGSAKLADTIAGDIARLCQ